MWLDLVRLLAGGVMLYFGAEWLVKGAAGIARALGVSALAIGLTVVAYGTSAPELAVSLLAAVEGQSAIALGNVVGSNIANIALILGITALIAPPFVDKTLIRREVPILIVSAMAVLGVLLDGEISRLEGAVLLFGALAFTWLTLRTAKEVPPAGELVREAKGELEEENVEGPKWKLALFAVAGLAVLIGGGKVFVDGAVGVATAFGMSERVVGLTVVAVGTSLPELAASLVAALRGHSAMAIGNVIGSNIFNILLILGGASLAQPIVGSLDTMRLDLAVLIGVTLFASLLLRKERLISRVEGGILVGCYAAFLGLLVVT